MVLYAGIARAASSESTIRLIPTGFDPLTNDCGMPFVDPGAIAVSLTPKRIVHLLVQNATPVGSGVMIPDAYRTVLAAGSNYTDAKLETTTTPLLSPNPLREDLEFLFRTVEESHPNIYAHLTKDQYSRVTDEIRRPHSKLQCQVSTAHFVAVGGMRDKGGVKPDHAMRQMPEDNSSGIDTVLEYALALTRTSALQESQ